MRQSTLVLVVAPDGAFRHSLEFALQAEGFDSDAHETVADAVCSHHVARAACAIVDDKAVWDWQEDGAALRALGRPVLFLAGGRRPLPLWPMTSVLTKPYLGAPLIDAVRASVVTFDATAT